MKRIFQVLISALVLGAAFVPGEAAGVTDELTKKECSACHMAYPPGFLPARSWDALTNDLGKHFGEDASLAPEATASIKAYLMANAADASGKLRGFARGIKADQTPLRISELPRFLNEHGKFLDKTMKRIGSVSNCVACHQGAEQGIFEDD